MGREKREAWSIASTSADEWIDICGEKEREADGWIVVEEQEGEAEGRKEKQLDR